jgi:hypothetical protein
MKTEDQAGKQREITYQIGWKKGKIERHDQGKPCIDDGKNERTASKLFRLHERLVWRPAGAAPKSWLFPLLYLLPALLFLLTFVLVFHLSHP